MTRTEYQTLTATYIDAQDLTDLVLDDEVANGIFAKEIKSLTFEIDTVEHGRFDDEPDVAADITDIRIELTRQDGSIVSDFDSVALALGKIWLRQIRNQAVSNQLI
jgi:hypothetical protein